MSIITTLRLTSKKDVAKCDEITC